MDAQDRGTTQQTDGEDRQTAQQLDTQTDGRTPPQPCSGQTDMATQDRWTPRRTTRRKPTDTWTPGRSDRHPDRQTDTQKDRWTTQHSAMDGETPRGADGPPRPYGHPDGHGALAPSRKGLGAGAGVTHLTQVEDEAVAGVEAGPAQVPLGRPNFLPALHLVEPAHGAGASAGAHGPEGRIHAALLQAQGAEHPAGTPTPREGWPAPVGGCRAPRRGAEHPARRLGIWKGC